MQVIGYMGVSTEAQVCEGVSLAAQRPGLPPTPR
jgi:hypothetical protein